MTDSRIRYFVVDAFTNRPFKGNPAAVVPLDQWRDDAWLQNVAMEMNLSETAFLVPNSKGYDLRWFTPTSHIRRSRFSKHLKLPTDGVPFEEFKNWWHNKKWNSIDWPSAGRA